MALIVDCHRLYFWFQKDFSKVSRRLKIRLVCNLICCYSLSTLNIAETNNKISIRSDSVIISSLKAMKTTFLVFFPPNIKYVKNKSGLDGMHVAVSDMTNAFLLRIYLLPLSDYFSMVNFPRICRVFKKKKKI